MLWQRLSLVRPQLFIISPFSILQLISGEIFTTEYDFELRLIERIKVINMNSTIKRKRIKCSLDVPICCTNASFIILNSSVIKLCRKGDYISSTNNYLKLILAYVTERSDIFFR